VVAVTNLFASDLTNDGVASSLDNFLQAVDAVLSHFSHFAGPPSLPDNFSRSAATLIISPP